jgi:peptide deformylase
MAEKVEIINKPHKCLSSKAKEVSADFIVSVEIQQILKDMKEAMESQDDGVAIAAPQINVPLRIFMIAKKAYHKNSKDMETVFINPKILKLSKDKEYMLEGCLSVRWIYGEVLRSVKCTIEYTDINGKLKTKGASGLISQIFQHEIDHLEGILFDSKAINKEDLPPEKLAQSGYVSKDKSQNLEEYISSNKK